MKKNVLLICVDHWPAALLGCAGRGDIMTPTLDDLARNGVRFDRMYSECPVCIPARRSMMTGLSPRTHGDRVYSERMEMPPVATLAQTFRDHGYQAHAVGKLHVYPQRSRIGFDDVILAEEGRYEFGVVDDYQRWLGEQGHAGEEFLHTVGSNSYHTRPWHLEERLHPTNWATLQMAKQMKRKDPTRPAFYYCSYQFPHPPLVPLQSYWDMYDEEEIDGPVSGNWAEDAPILRAMREHGGRYSLKEQRRARRAFYAQCTHIDNQIRLLIGTLRECNLLEDTIIAFTSDHGDMLFDHGMVAKRCFYDGAARVPLILSGQPVEAWRGTVQHGLGCMRDIMPTLLDLCGIPIPDTVEGIPLLGGQTREELYGEVGEGAKATRMLVKNAYKLIYYPCGNLLQLFDLERDPQERDDLSADPVYAETMREMTGRLMSHLYGGDLEWIRDGTLIGFPAEDGLARAPIFRDNQRGYHWPAPFGYSNIGKNV